MKRFSQIPLLILNSLIRFYQKFISPFLGAHCRFHPSCSEYCRQCLQKYGVFKGLYLGIRRILRCHPYSEGGVDPVP